MGAPADALEALKAGPTWKEKLEAVKALSSFVSKMDTFCEFWRYE